MANKNPMRHRAFYEKEASVYHELRYESTYGNLFRKLHYMCMEELLTSVSRDNSDVLEVACGTGHTSTFLSSLGFEFTACDLTPEMLGQAKEKVEKLDVQRTRFVQTNAMTLPFSDARFDLIVSTRFLHLFPLREHEQVLKEMVRVLKPGGKILVDFDNWSSRWIMMLPYLIYNLIKYRRMAPYAIYNRIAPTGAMMERLGLSELSVLGVGGTHLVAATYWSDSLAERLGKMHRYNPWRLLAEQFIVFGTKR